MSCTCMHIIHRYECYVHPISIIISQILNRKISRLIELPMTSRIMCCNVIIFVQHIYLLTLFFLLFFSRIPLILSHHHVPPLALVATRTFPTTRQATRGHIAMGSGEVTVKWCHKERSQKLPADCGASGSRLQQSCARMS